MNNISTNKSGLLFAILLGGLHLVWALLIAVGLAQSLMDFIFKLHMINPFMTVSDFSFGLAAGLVVVTAIIGYVVGYILAWVWNYLHR